MRIVNMVFSIVIGLGGLAYIITGVHEDNIASVAAGWAMLIYARQGIIDDDIKELKEDIKELKNQKLKK